MMQHHSIRVLAWAVALCLGLPTICFAAQPAEPGMDFDQRRTWMIELFRGKSIRGHQKTGIPDAFGRLIASEGNDPAALEYLSNYPVKSNEFFDYPWLAYALHKWGDRFTPEQMQRLRGNLTDKVRDWLDHGTENHAAMRVASAYLVAQYFPDATWRVGNRELSSEQMMAQAKDRMLRRGRGFYRIGNNEQLSTSYAFLNAYPFLGLYDFAEDPEVRDIAEALLLYHAATVAANSFDGHMMPPLNRRAPQFRFAPPQWRGHRVTAIHHTISWLLWGQNEVLDIDLTNAGEPPFALFFAVTNWRMPDAINRIAGGEGTPYELRSVLSGFNEWGRTDAVETWRYLYRDRDFAIGAPLSHRFKPAGFYLDYDLISVAWKSPHRYRALEVSHPYWRSNHGENAWGERHSPFMQSAAYRNALIVLFDIPQADPWADRGAERYWVEQRNEHADNLIKLGQARFPSTVQDLTQEGDGYFFRDGDVFVAVRVLRPGHELDRSVPDRQARRGQTFREGEVDTLFAIKSREARTGFVVEMGTAEEHGSLEAFTKAVLANELIADWDAMRVRYRTTSGDLLEMTYDKDYTEDSNGFILMAPAIEVNGKALDMASWPIMDSPVVRLAEGVLTVEQGDERLVVDWSGELPRFER